MIERQKREKIIIILKNIATIFVVFSMVFVLIFLIQGWVIDFNDGKTVRTGLVQFASNINGSTVEIGEKTLSEKTNTKTQLKPGEYEFKMWFEKYELWYRKASVKSGEVLWLNYARLVPKEKKITSHLQFENLKSVKFSDNKEKAFVINETDEGLANFSIVQLGETPKTTEVKVPESLFSRELADGENTFSKIAENITIESLNENATRAILKWKNGENYEWLAIDLSDPERSINLTDNFSTSFSKIAPKNRNHSKLYALTADFHLREIDLGAQTISSNLLSDVVDFDIYNDEISTFVQKNSNGKFSVGIFRIDKQAVILAKDFATQPRIITGVYYGENYVHILDGQKVLIFKGQEWSGDRKPKKIREINLDFKVEDFEINAENRILKIGSASKTVTFDLETNSKCEISAGGLKWLDSFVLYNFENEKMVMRDFDGSNKYSIFGAKSNFSVTLSKDGKYIYGITDESEGNSQLSRVQMVL